MSDRRRYSDDWYEERRLDAMDADRDKYDEEHEEDETGEDDD